MIDRKVFTYTKTQSTHKWLSEECLTVKKKRSAKLIDSAVEQPASVLFQTHFFISSVCFFKVGESFYWLCYGKRGRDIKKGNYMKEMEMYK